MTPDKNNTKLPQSSGIVSAFLNGKAKQDFEKWLDIQEVAPYKVMFWDIPKIVQVAYIVEWFDSIGFHIGRDTVDNYWLENSTFFERLEINGYDYIVILKSISEAIEKANELYNAHFLADTQAEH
jgi:hypothetical protein